MKSGEEFEELKFSPLEKIQHSMLSMLISPDNAIILSEKFYGKRSESGVLKTFIEEIRDNIDIAGASPEFLAKFIPEYIFQTLKEQMKTGELLAFNKSMVNDLTHAYDEKESIPTRNAYKTKVFNKILHKIGPHGLKQVQTLRAKNPNNWVSDAISSVQSNLPSVPIETIEEMLKQAFRERGTIEYADHFSKYFKVQKVLGAGTVGITALVTFKESPNASERVRVVKIIRENTVKRFLSDYKCMNNAIDAMLAEHLCKASEAASFKQFNEEKIQKELEETNSNLENAQIVERPYEGPGVTTIKCDLDLYGKADNVIFMEPALGIELGKYLKQIHKALADPALTQEEKSNYLQQLATLRSSYCNLINTHMKRVEKNLPVHSDLHAGNIFYDPESHLISVLDLGSVARPVSKISHFKLRQFLFSTYLSVITGDAQYLRFYYDNHIKNPEATQKSLEQNDIDSMLAEIQTTLDKFREDNANQHVINIEKNFNQVMEIISNKAITVGTSIVPSALLSLARSNKLLIEQLDELNKDLAGTDFAASIPYKQRTSLSIALYAMIHEGKAANKELWTKESWEYFVNNCLWHPGGRDQLMFEKKVIYGIFGLSKREADQLDLFILSSAITGPMALHIGTTYLSRAIKKMYAEIPKFAERYELSEKLQSIRENDFPKYYTQLKEFHANLFKKNSEPNIYLPKLNPLPKPKLIIPATSSKISPMEYKPRLSISNNNIFKTAYSKALPFKRQLPGMIVGGALVYGAQKLYENYSSQSSSSANKN